MPTVAAAQLASVSAALECGRARSVVHARHGADRGPRVARDRDRRQLGRRIDRADDARLRRGRLRVLRRRRANLSRARAATEAGEESVVHVGLINEEGYPHAARLDFVDNQVDPQHGTIRARAVLDNRDGRFTPGLFARMKLVSPSRYSARARRRSCDRHRSRQALRVRRRRAGRRAVPLRRDGPARRRLAHRDERSRGRRRRDRQRLAARSPRRDGRGRRASPWATTARARAARS